MQVLIDNGKAVVKGLYSEREIIKAVGGYEKWDPARKCWVFPLSRLPYICDYLKVETNQEVETVLSQLKLDYEKRKLALQTAEKIKKGQYNQPPGGVLMYHQKQALSLLNLFPTYALFLETGCGKSLVAIKRIEILQVPTLVIAPLSTLESVWVEEIKKWSNLKAINLWRHCKSKGYEIPKGYDVYLINYESVKKLGEQIRNSDIQFCVIDESSKLKDASSQISKFCIEMRDHFKYRLILSGLPSPNSLLEYFSQLCFINPDLLGSNYFRFRNIYFYASGFGGFQYLCNQENQVKIMNKVYEQAFFVKKTDCLDLPDKVYEYRTFEMDKIQAKAYKDMKKHNVLEFNNKTILSANELSKIMKLREVTSGFCISNEGMPVKISDSKFKLLLETLSEISNDKQVIIWVNFHYEVKSIKDLLGDEAVTLYGEMPQKEKDLAIQDFKNGKYRFLIANPCSGGWGLNLANCSYAVWFSLSYSHEQHSQANDRIYRKGQINKCTYIYLLAEDSIDEVIYRVLQKKEVMSSVCLEMLKGNN